MRGGRGEGGTTSAISTMEGGTEGEVCGGFVIVREARATASVAYNSE